ncbi:MAG: DUF1616 domain-containing protein [Methanomicrobiales archaeon]
MNKKNFYLDLIIIMSFTVLATVIFNFNLLSQEQWLNWIFIIPLIFFFPGYAIITILFPVKEDLNLVFRIILGLAISIAILPAYGFLIYYSPFNVFSDYFILITGILTLIFSIIAYIRRYKKMKEYGAHAKTDQVKKELIEIYRLRYTIRDLLITGILTVMSILLIYLDMFQVVAHFLFTVLLPGYALVSVIFPDLREFSFLKKSILSVGLSIILVLVIGSISEFMVFLSLENTFIILAILTSILLFIAGLRRIKKSRQQNKLIKKTGKLEKDEKIYVRKLDKPSKTLESSLLFSNRDLDLLVFLTFLAVLFTSINPLNQTIFRNIFVMPLILIIPGYALLAAIFPKLMASRKTKSQLFKILLVGIILSLLMTLCIGVMAFIAPVSISSVLCLGVISLVSGLLLIVAYVRRRRLARLKFIKSEITRKKEDDQVIRETVKLRQLTQKEGLESESVLDDLKEPVLPTSEDSSKSDLIHPAGRKESPLVKPYSARFKFLSNDLFLILLLTVLTVVFVTVPVLNQTVVRTILGLLFILFIPGYSLIAALFPKKSDLDGIERFALSFGLSIAITPLIGLILNYTPWGIRLDPILIALTILTLSLIIIASIRRRRLPEKEKFSLGLKDQLKKLKISFSKEKKLDKILSIILIISIILAISTTIYIIVTPKEGEKFTEFYILGPGGKASDYPTNLTVNQTGTVIVGIVNHEYSNVTYNFQIKYNGTTITNRNLTLDHNEKWEQNITFNAGAPGANKKLEFLLYKLPDKDKVYRSLHLWVDVS